MVHLVARRREEVPGAPPEGMSESAGRVGEGEGRGQAELRAPGMAGSAALVLEEVE